ncbi:zf-HC2 domain-containing protein [Solibacillus sp. CAU 1738]|uniref:zf-HC2 domain-containing protein n=1 Tax=Solibacillus sp. CAU 1738 TaxID=3140363 RepID=UPI00326080BD
MNCNIIKDLLPSYIDEVCSEETVEMVEEHIQYCEECKQTLKRMQQQTDYVQTIPEEVKKAVTPFKKINKKRRIQVITAIIMTFLMTFFISTVSYLVYQEVGVVHEFFTPMLRADVHITNDTEEWERIYFGDNEYLEFDSIFFKKEIVNSASSEHELDIVLRIKDVNNNVLIDEILIPSGTKINLDELKRYEKYIVEIKAPQGRFFINAV